MGSPDAALGTYLQALDSEHASGHGTEHSYRPAFKQLIESVGDARATNEARRVACGAPDFTVWRPTTSGGRTIGYVETKDLGTPLSVAARTAQLSRYRSALPNLLLTNYVEFWWYVDGEKRQTARLADVSPSGIKPLPGEMQQVGALLAQFVAHEPPSIANPLDLADRMARLTRLIRDVVVQAFAREAASRFMCDLRSAFEEVLIPRLTKSDFADMFAQTVAYGLFAAAANHQPDTPFDRRSAAYEIPRTNPFLRKLFAAITGPDLDEEPFAGLVDDLAQLLAVADMQSILSAFGEHGRRGDPVVHFYETFLAAYDPRVREMRGVYYTPEPVVSYIVRSVDDLLRTAFGCSDGLATSSNPMDSADPTTDSQRVLLLDPACGSGTFLHSTVGLIRQRFEDRQDAGKWAAYVREQLVPRLFGFELLVAPYAVAHLKLGMQLAGHDLPEDTRDRWAYDLASSERLNVYLTNTLEEAIRKSELLLGSYIAEEANAAASIKRELPILVVMGNPPYSGHSANTGPWIRRLVGDYLEATPMAVRPAQGKWLQDDYVKFIRFGQWRIDRTGAGVLAFITNHSYIDSPTFAGMRHSLMQSFSDIYVLDLHGNAKKGERAPDGAVDENVFDIQQGVAISLFVKEAGRSGPARIHHADIYGDRESKYEWLGSHDLTTTGWTEVAPTAPRYLFVPQDVSLLEEFERGWSIAAIMNQNGKPAPGILTTHDQFAISRSRAEAEQKIERFLLTEDQDEAESLWRLCRQDQWDYTRAKKALGEGDWREAIRPVLYRPFDTRWTVFDPNVAVHRRERVTRHLHAGPNLALVTSKSTKGEAFAHIQVTRVAPEVICMSPKTSNNGFVFPLYLYPSTDGPQRRLLLDDEPVARQPNLDPAFVEQLADRIALRFVPDGLGNLTRTFGPEDVFRYIYALLHVPAYRTRYVDLLRHDFPHIPLPTDRELFVALAEQGAELIRLHLFEGPAPATSTSFPIPGNNEVAPGHPRFSTSNEKDPSDGRVYISPDRPGTAGQYFQGVPRRVWEFHVGGYRPCEKWLKDRRRLELTYADIAHYERIVATIGRTIEIMDALEALAPTWPLEAVSNPLATL